MTDYPNYTDPSRFLSVDFEIVGLVQGVFFRKYALHAANKLGVTGWIKNTRTGGITGNIQGDKGRVALMKEWLCTVGSPQCVILACKFSNERELINLDHHHFTISPSDW
ncbi:acylphosphatase-1-like [Dreissena polymorpha]|uniref:acylphosphatase n=1 Tax=Dreissena polymorpha TaxID=45954 RepID=A0A9D4LI76_DREPO|nr:acylphosphatase-1-like [Dreissena polymorpha]KAH3859043.1 hypothetical protein DPMN_101689 [Dreissena polymorpha]